jgi:hypothetical protein
LKKEGLGRWTNLLVGIVGAVLGGEVFELLRIDLGLAEGHLRGSHRCLSWLAGSDFRVADHRENQSKKRRKIPTQPLGCRQVSGKRPLSYLEW